jgi:hypothetical protein
LPVVLGEDDAGEQHDRTHHGVGAEVDRLAEPEQPCDEPDQRVDDEDHRHHRGRQATLLQGRLAEQDRRRAESERDVERGVLERPGEAGGELGADGLQRDRCDPVTQAGDRRECQDPPDPGVGWCRGA